MSTGTDKDKWINDVMHSMDGMQKATSNPFLYEKIGFRMQQKGNKSAEINKVFVPRWVALMILIVLVNCLSIVKMINKQHHNTNTDKRLLSEFDTETTYNY